MGGNWRRPPTFTQPVGVLYYVEEKGNVMVS